MRRHALNHEGGGSDTAAMNTRDTNEINIQKGHAHYMYVAKKRARKSTHTHANWSIFFC